MNRDSDYFDYLIIGAGIIGLTVARDLKLRNPDSNICIIDKEEDVAKHSSGRNSGVIHAGFYYTEDSLKAKFTRDGNIAMKNYCKKNGLKLNECGKIIVAQNESEISGLEELKKRGDKNGVELRWLEEEDVYEIDQNVKTCKRALFSPNTATADPIEVSECLRDELLDLGVEIRFNCAFKGKSGEGVKTGNGVINYGYMINCAGLYADKIAKEFGFSKNKVIMPFKGIYLKHNGQSDTVATNVYPVPNLLNPFLGVHYTVTASGKVKIGPTSIPAFWRENYSGFSKFKIGELLQIGFHMARLFIWNSFGFRALAFQEISKYRKSNFTRLATNMVHEVDTGGFDEWSVPGIRAQLLDTRTLELLMDFVIEGDEKTLHVLNAVSPGWTCSFPFSKHIVDTANSFRD